MLEKTKQQVKKEWRLYIGNIIEILIQQIIFIIIAGFVSGLVWLFSAVFSLIFMFVITEATLTTVVTMMAKITFAIILIGQEGYLYYYIYRKGR